MQPINLTSAIVTGKDFVKKIRNTTGVDVKACYQCGKCSAGCPVAFAMDYTPRMVMRLLQLGQKEEVLKARSIWLCAQCETCSSRCPRNLHPDKVMEFLRIEAKNAGIKADYPVAAFNEIFLKSVESGGRSYEFGLAIGHNLATRKLMKDAGLAPAMLAKGKLKIMPPKIKGIDQVRRIFANVRKMEGE